MKNKEQLYQEVEKLPLFELTEAYIRKVGDYIEQKEKAVVEIGKTESVAYVSPRYCLVQFKSIFTPILDKIEDCAGRVDSYGGFSRMVLFPKAGDFENKWGLIAMNSVDKTSSVIIKFCVKHNEKTITLPKKVAGYVKPHSTKGVINTKDFIQIITKVKDQWSSITGKFTEYQVTEENIGDIISNVKLEDKAFIKQTKKKLMNVESYNLWEFFMDLIDRISEKNYKSEIHKSRKMDRICEGIINYGIMLRI